MTSPKDKAKEIYNNFNSIIFSQNYYEKYIQTKSYSKDCCDRIINALPYPNDVDYNYWNDVKTEIHKI